MVYLWADHHEQAVMGKQYSGCGLCLHMHMFILLSYRYPCKQTHQKSLVRILEAMMNLLYDCIVHYKMEWDMFKIRGLGVVNAWWQMYNFTKAAKHTDIKRRCTHLHRYDPYSVLLSQHIICNGSIMFH